jgi:hypothetical protein
MLTVSELERELGTLVGMIRRFAPAHAQPRALPWPDPAASPGCRPGAR